MHKILYCNLVYIAFSLCLLLSMSFINIADAELNNESKFNMLNNCANEESALTRLECYDKVLRPNMGFKSDNQQRSAIWSWIVDQEKQRIENNTEIIVNLFDKGDRVLLTTPAIGHQPPRPILAFSCVDNITRMQIVLFNPMNNKNTPIKLETDKSSLSANWFVRENGFIFESSRGLLGIEQIKRLLDAKSLTLKSDEPILNGLVFNLTGLETAIKPLRTSCHW